MGFLRRIFSSKKPSNPPPTAPNSKPTKNTKRWSFTNKTHTTASQLNVSNSNSLSTPYAADNSDANKHAIAVAAATAAVAEAALAAAHAAAEVVRLTSGGASAHGGGTHRRWLEAAASVKIQSAFRGYLARRALRALKALVKLQALVRGHIVRKQTSDMLRRMQTLVRLQARARASRTHKSESLHYNSKFALSHHPVPASPNKNKHQLRAFSTKVDGSSALKRCDSHSNFRNIIDLEKPRYDSNWFDRWMEENLRNSHRETPLRTQQADDEKSDKILEVDTWKPHFNPQQSKKNFQTSQHMLASDYSSQSYMAFNSPSKYSTKATNPNPSLSSGDTLSVSSMKLPARGDAAATRTSGNSPQMFSASSRPGNGAKRSPFSPTRSEYLWGFFGGYADHPNYMANTESSLAKVRSQSAPRQRLDFGRYGSTKRSYQDADTFSEMGFAHPASSSINTLGRANLR